MNETIILTLTQHPLWGFILQPVVVAVEQEGWLTIHENAGSKCPSLALMNDSSKEIVKYSCNYSDKALMKNFSKEKNITDFFKKVTKDTIDNQIRPFIESNQKKILSLIESSEMPIYMRKSIKDRTLHELERICISEGFSTAVFYFVKDNETGLKYYIRVKQGDQEEINLFGKTFYTISTEPAVIVIDNLMLVFQDIDANKLLPFFSKSHIEVPAPSETRYLKSFILNCLKNYTVKTEGLNIKKVEPKKVASLTLENDANNELKLTLAFLYDDSKISFNNNDKKVVLVDESENEAGLKWFYPDKIWENKQTELLLTIGLKHDGSGNFSLDNATSTIKDWIKENELLLKDFVVSQNISNRNTSTKKSPLKA